MKRENGFYWARIDLDWVVVEWENNAWFKTGTCVAFDDSEFNQIIEEKIVMMFDSGRDWKYDDDKSFF